VQIRWRAHSLSPFYFVFRHRGHTGFSVSIFGYWSVKARSQIRRKRKARIYSESETISPVPQGNQGQKLVRRRSKRLGTSWVNRGWSEAVLSFGPLVELFCIFKIASWDIRGSERWEWQFPTISLCRRCFGLRPMVGPFGSFKIASWDDRGKERSRMMCPSSLVCQSMNPSSVSDGLSSVGFVYQGIKTPKVFIWLCFWVGWCWPGDACLRWYLLNTSQRMNILTYEKGVSRQIRIRIILCAPFTATQSNPNLDGWWWCASINPNLGAPVLAWFTPNNLMRFANKVLACPNFR
jgi:hypothetical protein